VSSSFDAPGLELAGRVRARDIQMAAVADVRRRVLMISGAVDAVDHDVSMSLSLPETGRWQVIKSETNLTDRTWSAMQVSTDEHTTFVDSQETMILSRQFARTFLTPELRRLTLFDGEVRPGEAVLMTFELECATRRPVYSHSRYVAGDADTPAAVAAAVERIVADGMPQRPVLEMIVPVTVIG
jgi:Family of unknown function (DUF6423)